MSTKDNKIKYDVKYKIVLLGEAGVGKSSLMRCFLGKPFEIGLISTIGFDFVHKTLQIDGAEVNLEIWDTAGQEQYQAITLSTFRGSKGIIIVYDVTDKRSFQRLTYWLKSIELEFNNNEEPMPVFIVGNKTDLGENRVISVEEGKEKADKNCVRGFRETSVKTDPDGVQRVFERMAYILTETHDPKLMTSHMTPKERAESGRSLKQDAKDYMKNNGSSSFSFSSTNSKVCSHSTSIKLGKGKDEVREKSGCC